MLKNLRETMTDDLSKLYRQVLKQGIKAPAVLSPHSENVPVDKSTILTRLTNTYLTIGSQLAGCSEEEIDRCPMPHPALGLISAREMIHSIKIHTQHRLAVLSAY